MTIVLPAAGVVLTDSYPLVKRAMAGEQTVETWVIGHCRVLVPFHESDVIINDCLTLMFS